MVVLPSEGDVGVDGNGSFGRDWDGNTLSNTGVFFWKICCTTAKHIDLTCGKSILIGLVKGLVGGGSLVLEILCNYFSEKGFSIVISKNERERVTTECSKKLSRGCLWRVHAFLSC